MTHTTLQSALEALYGLERRKDRLGLEGTRALLGALGNPERRFRAVHVAGTNGKGSTCSLVERVLREAGFRTGLFTSPHLVDFRERIRVSGRWADEAWLFRQLERIQSLPEGKDRTFFEVVTALGFLYFAEQGVEWAVVEVGLGGRLDTTNVLQPAMSVITSIGLDHTEILGDTIEQIAEEKAGIVKPGVPVVSPPLAPEAEAVIARIARERGSRYYPFQDREDLHALTRGMSWTQNAVQETNVLAARGALAVLRDLGVELSDEVIRRGFALADWPGRFEVCAREPRLWWDGAHNPEGAGWLGHQLQFHDFSALVLAMSRDKDARGFLTAMGDGIPRRRLFATRSRSERALDPERIAGIARELGWEASVEPTVPAACRAALAATGGGVLLTGSLFAVGEAMEAFGGAPREFL